MPSSNPDYDIQQAWNAANHAAEERDMYKIISTTLGILLLIAVCAAGYLAVLCQ